MTYTPAAGTVAARVVAWLHARPSGEYNAAQIGEALKVDPKIIAIIRCGGTRIWRAADTPRR